MLLAVHVAIALHVLHWRLAGATLAPLELNEAMHTLELGLVTAGFVLMAAILVSVLFLGRFFCSWGCHLLALQDLSAWFLAKLGIRPAPVRARWLALVPAAVAAYMFVWPHVARGLVALAPAAAAWVGERPAFRLRIHDDQQGWASFWTSDWTRNLPGPGIALATFLVCGFLLVWLLGTRSFCRDLCPYGALFSLADRFAARRIVLAGDCTACGRCTAACDSGVSVYEQVARFGTVRSGDCLKDLDCVAVCPTGGLVYGRAPRPLAAPRETPRRAERTRGEELLGALAFVATLAAFRGLYREVPFFLSLALALLAASAAVVARRLASRPEVRWQRWVLKQSGRVTHGGRIACAALALFALFVAHSGALRSLEVASDHAWRRWTAGGAPGAPLEDPGDALLAALELRSRWGLWPAGDLPVRRVAVRLARADRLAAARRFPEALAEIDAAVAADPASAVPHYNAGVLLAALGESERAIGAFRAAVERDPADADGWNNLGFLLGGRGETAEAESSLRRALELAPGAALPCYNLAALLARTGRAAEAARVDATCAP